MSNARIYTITDSAGTKRLVKAGNPSQAFRFVARKAYTVAAAKPMEVAYCMAAGIPLEDATAEPADEEQTP